MIMRYINEFVEGAKIQAAFLLRSREMRAARNGDAYLVVEIADRTGSISGVLFRPNRAASAVPVGSIVEVAGVVTTFRGERRLSIDSLRPAASWEPTELLRPSRRPLDEMKKEFGDVVRSVTHRGLVALLREVFREQDVFSRFCAAPASQSYHHAHVGGLLEHSLSVASMCGEMASRYPGINRDLLVAAALLHDVGKIDELSFDAGISYTDEGRLVGHVVTGAMKVRQAAEKIGLEPGLRMLLEHVVLSHHGELEWGSPKRPATMESLVLHHVDNLDAKAASLADILHGAAAADECWTDATNLFRRPLYAPRPMEDDRLVKAHEDDQHYRLTA